jgi:pimeloyl-ACP methyl ester carboxylesterase
MLAGTAAAGISLAALSTLNISEARPPMPTDSIRPFRVNIPQKVIDDMRRRIQATIWPEKETVSDDTQGVQLATMQKLAKYWGTEYDWRKVETKLNSYPQFITEIDGLDIHFLHVKSKHENAMPIIVTHGWPGSVVEQLKIIEPLVNPTAHGGTAADAFHVVIPSIPGYGFSGKPSTTGWDPVHIASAWNVLMKRLGYKKYVAQGGDWGAIITEQMGVQAPPELLAIHTNLPHAVPAEIFAALPSHMPPAGSSADEKWAFERLDFFFAHGLAYAQEMNQRPQTLYGIADSPIGLAAWFLDHDQKSYQMIARVFDGKMEGLTRDDVLDNLTGISSGRLYWENKLPFFAPLGVKVPVGVSAFPDELMQVPRSWAERAYPKLVYYNRPEKGGHFAAWEQPKFLTNDMRATFQTVR